jgi:O-antigen/teichoic acid export membrane protein
VTQFDTAVPRSRSLPRDALVLAAGMAVANAGNYGFNLVMAFLLGPEAYGALAALLALVLVGSVPGLALQAVVARRTALAGDAAWPGAGWLVGRAGLGLLLLALLAGPGLVLFLHLEGAAPVLWLALAVAPTPLLFAVQGLLQGRERFGALATVMVAGAAVKLAIGLALVAAGLGVGGAMAGVAAGAALAAIAGLRLAAPAAPGVVDDRTPPGPGSATLPHRGARARAWAGGGGSGAEWWREVGTATTGLMGLFLLANLDVLLARHYLDRAAAGRYALGAVVAKVAFWAPQFLVTLIFPRLAGGADPRRLLGGSALLIGGFGGLLAAVLAGADRLGLAVPVLGGGYAGLGPLLPLFAALGTGLALVQLLLFEGIATRDRRMGRAVVAALVAEVALVAGPLHGGPGQVAGAALAVVAGLAAAGWWLLRRRLGRRPLPAVP